MAERKSERIEEISLTGSIVGEIYDISETGIGYHSSVAYNEGQLLLVKMNDMRLHAKVVYCRKMKEGAHLGLEYTDLKDDQKGIIRDCVAGFSKGVPVLFSILS